MEKGKIVEHRRKRDLSTYKRGKGEGKEW